jgi:hypothetical protein
MYSILHEGQIFNYDVNYYSVKFAQQKNELFQKLSYVDNMTPEKLSISSNFKKVLDQYKINKKYDNLPINKKRVVYNNVKAQLVDLVDQTVVAY